MKKDNLSEFLITSHFESLRRGQKFVYGLPLHVTIQQYFQIKNRDISAFHDELERLVSETNPIEVIGENEDMFGLKRDTPVRLVRSLGGEALHDFHLKTGDLLSEFGAPIQNPEWAGVNYRPHVTLGDGGMFTEGDRRLLCNVELIERIIGVKVVREVFGFNIR
jgi:2'-5' RNA ligase